MYNYLYNLYNNSSRNNKVLLLISVLAFTFLFIRMVYFNSFRFLFLSWNLFLAFVPYFITLYIIKKRTNINRFKLVILLTIWWLFLPNAPYIITDLVHLKLSTYQSVWLDMLILYLFSIAGLLFGYKSVKNAAQIISHHFGTKFNAMFVNLSVLSCGFGIYLGRIVRLNSWDMILHPFVNLQYILKLFVNPDNSTIAWSFSLIVGFFLLALYHIFNLFASYDNKEKSIL
jgi:uncharacterized membrane protein